MHPADYGTCILGQKAGIERKLGHQLGNEGLVADAGEVVRLGELHFEEMPTEAFPERRASTLVGHAAHLGDHLVAEQLAKLGDEQKARLRQQTAVEASTVIGMQEQRAQFGVASQVVGHEQRRHLAMDVQLLRSADGQADPVVVPGLTQADGAGYRRNAHHLAGIVFEDEQVVGIGTFGLATKCLLRPADPVRQALLVGRQRGQASAGAASQVDQGRQVGTAHGTNDHKASRFLKSAAGTLLCP